METVTKQFRKRNAILKCLQETDCHPSAEMVHELLQQEHPDISLATIYRNLARFREEGIITGVATVQGTERFDACTLPHVHFICTNCSAVMDLPRIPIPQYPREALEGCQVDTCQLTFTGLCSKCRA